MFRFHWLIFRSHISKKFWYREKMSSQFVYVPTVSYFSSTELTKNFGYWGKLPGASLRENFVAYMTSYINLKHEWRVLKILETSYSFIWRLATPGKIKTSGVERNTAPLRLNVNNQDNLTVGVAIDSLDTGLHCTRHLCECLCPIALGSWGAEILINLFLPNFLPKLNIHSLDNRPIRNNCPCRVNCPRNHRVRETVVPTDFVSSSVPC